MTALEDLTRLVFRGMVRNDRRPVRDDIAWSLAEDTAGSILAAGFTRAVRDVKPDTESEEQR